MMATGSQLEKSALARAVPLTIVDRLMGLLGQARVGWSGMAVSQRRWAVAAAVLLAAVAGVLLWDALRPDWRTLYAGMEPEDARQTGQTLALAQIPFETTPDGAGIRVPAAQLDKARLATASKGGVKSGRLGFEIFDKPNWVGSEFDEQVNYQRALEGELEHTVGSLGDVESARVHLVMPHDSLFREQERPAKASVVLKLRRRTLADGEAESIRNLVASAVDGLAPERVVLVDAAGHLQLGPKTEESLRLGAEQALEEKLVSTLEPVTGQGNVRASVTLSYDPSASEETDETYDPDQVVTLSMQRTEQSTGPAPVAAGIPGAASNAPNTQALPVYPRETSPPQSAKTESGTYGASKTVRHVVQSPGQLRRMTAAVVVNDRLAQTAGKGKAALWQPRTAAELGHLTALAQAAVGFDAARGDSLTVEDLAFDDNRSLPPASLAGQVLGVAQRSPVLVKYAALLVGLALVMAFGVRPALGKAAARPAAKLKAGELAVKAVSEAASQAALRPPSEPAELDPDRIRAQEIFEQVTGQLKREPSQSSRLLQSWIHSE
jgi:flagellar M-ring protein FliF